MEKGDDFMHFYFDSENRLNITGSSYTAMREDVKEMYQFDTITLPLGKGLTQFLNADIDKWGNALKSLILDMINNYDENKINKYIAKFEKLFSDIAYFSAYRALLYNNLLIFYKHHDLLVNNCKKICEFLETKEFNLPLVDNNKPQIKKGEIDRLKNIQKLFKELSQLCLFPTIKNPLKELYKHQEKTFYERSYKLSAENILQFTDSDVPTTRFEVNQISKRKYELVEVNTTNDVYDICYKEFMMLISIDLRIKQCENKDCKKYFVPENRIDTLYCDDCKKAGAAMKKYQEKIKNNPVLAAYNKAYQSKYAKMVKPYRNNPTMKERKLYDLRQWTYEAKNRIAQLEFLDEKDRDKEANKLIEWFNEKED